VGLPISFIRRVAMKSEKIIWKFFVGIGGMLFSLAILSIVAGVFFSPNLDSIEIILLILLIPVTGILLFYSMKRFQQGVAYRIVEKPEGILAKMRRIKIDKLSVFLIGVSIVFIVYKVWMLLLTGESLNIFIILIPLWLFFVTNEILRSTIKVYKENRWLTLIQSMLYFFIVLCIAVISLVLALTVSPWHFVWLILGYLGILSGIYGVTFTALIIVYRPLEFTTGFITYICFGIFIGACIGFCAHLLSGDERKERGKTFSGAVLSFLLILIIVAIVIMTKIPS